MRALVGREAELAAALRLLEPDGPAALTIVAPAGQGKTALVEAVVETAHDAAREHGGRAVWRARPLETESLVAFSGLMNLLCEVPADAYDLLPPPQRSALRAALLLDEAHGEVDPRAVTAGLRTLVDTWAAPGVLVVVDDAQWLDAASARALTQALAHGRAGAARVLDAARPGVVRPALVAGAERLELAPLGESALFHVVRDRLGVVLDRGALRAVRRATGGNPLHALELVRVRALADRDGLAELVADRLSAFPRATLLALLAAALADTPTVEVVAAAREVPITTLLDLVEPPRQDGLVVLRGERIGFAHPLYASGVAELATASDKRDTHRALARVEPDADVAVRHRALSSQEPDAGLADALAVAADRVWRRGGWDAACDLAALAVDRTPDEVARFGRMVALGKRLHLTGRPAEAEQWLTAVRAQASGQPSWEAGVALGHLLVLSGRMDELRSLVAELDAAPLPARLAAEVRLHLAPEVAGRTPAVQLELVTAANALLQGLPGEDGLATEQAAGLCAEFERRLFMGERRADLLERAAQLQGREPARATYDSWLRVRAHDLLLGDHHHESRALFEQLLRTSAEVGDDVSVPLLLTQWIRLEERAGEWDRVTALLEEGRRSAVGQGQFFARMFDLVEAKLRALRGDAAGALPQVEASAAAFETLDDHGFSAIASRVLGEVHLLLGNDAAAWQALSRAADSEDAAQWRDPGGLLLLGDYVDAALAVGEVAAAAQRSAAVRERAERLGDRENVLAACEYADLAVLADAGDLGAAVDAAPRVVAAYDAEDRSAVERGRALLLAGRVCRRARAKRQAATMLERAAEIFTTLGCPTFVAQARDELARVGLRPTAPAGLTPTEEKVARLAAEGLRNHEIASQVFVSSRTVEAVLTRVYRKLTIRSRAELARALDALGD